MKHEWRILNENMNEFIIKNVYIQTFNCSLVMPYGDIDLGQYWLK